MTRAQEQTWLIVAVAIFAHALGLLALIVVSLRDPRTATQSTGREAVTAPPASVTLPQVASPPPPIELNVLGEANGEGDSIAHVDSPDVAKSNRQDDFEQAWTRQKPVFAAPSQLSARAATATPAPAKPQAADAEVGQFGPASVTGLKSFATATAGAQAHEAVAAAETQAKVEASARSASPPAAPDPAVAGPSDLDAFAKEEGITFSPGGIAARQGREVKLVRPRIDLGFMADATQLNARELTVKVRVETDDAGKPRSVMLLESSGSNVIDDAVRLAVYDSWFGGRMPDSFPFRVTFK